ncbi:MAG: UDP-N-acetylglucosamine 4,6-dehydratase [Chitinophagaceae bacterium]|nr:UDP-N-acetylglucosamine 4,6-dehydratase [Chitinophagaceae bacterium]
MNAQEQKILQLIGRERALFADDIEEHETELLRKIQGARFLVLGGAGSIGQAVCREIFRRNPAALHVVDLSENNLVELVRDLRSSLGYIAGDFKTFALDIDSSFFRAMAQLNGPYDYILNLSALKHVRSEKDVFTLLRLIQVNIFNTLETIRWAQRHGSQKYFCVSTDKAANPVNMMGASKRIMELFLMRESEQIPVSMARFANVAFSDGSLLHGFNQRMQKMQPLVAPNDIRRYFVTPRESGELCLMSCLLGENRSIFFPKLSEDLHLITFAEIADKYLRQAGYEPYPCGSEDEARALMQSLPQKKQWPCLYTTSDTTGEKDFEEFYMDGEQLDLHRFKNLGIVQSTLQFDANSLDAFQESFFEWKRSGNCSKEMIVNAFKNLLPEFDHKETGRYLDAKM